MTSVQKLLIRYARIAFFALAAIGSASFKAAHSYHLRGAIQGQRSFE